MPEKKTFSNMTVDEALEALGTTKNGLTAEEANKRLEKYGKNDLTVQIKAPAWLMFLKQFRDVLVLVLIAAGIISFLIGSFRDGIVILIIVIINALMGFIQQYRAEKIIERLKSLIQSPAKVIQDGMLMEFDQTKLVPGQIVFVDEGDKIPADIRIIECSNLRTNDFSLTGESMPQSKHNMAIPGRNSLGDMDNMAFVGTTVATGNGKGIVVATGMNTEMGKIAHMTQQTEEVMSPLQKELNHMANRLTILVIAISIILFIVAVMQGFNLYMSLIYVLGIAAALVPQALPAQITIALTTASARLADRKAVVKNLPSVETLGSTQVICTDKTGTLTKNEMTVRNVWFDGRSYSTTGIGYEPKGTLLDEAGNPLTQEEIDYIEIMMDASTMASNAKIHPPDDDHPNWYPVGDPTEAALITLSTKLGAHSPTEDEENPELHEIPFDSERKRMSSVRGFGEKEVLTMKGALSNILSISKHIYKDGKAEPIHERDISEIRAVSEGYQKKAMRVLAIAYRPLHTKGGEYVTEELERDMIFLGIVGMSDPPKEGVKEAIAAAHDAKIRIFIMTGDHAITAQAVGMEIGLSDHGGPTPVIVGRDLSEMSDEDLTKRLMEEEALIFSRVDPGDKLRIVKLLEAQNLVVAVTGDGVNDAPALRLAHIGVAMGQTGTDVAKEAAEVILLDDSFPTLVHAVEEGRTIYTNLRKTVIATLTANTAELSIVLLGLTAVAMGRWAIPILAIQILAIDLMAEILPLTFLTFDPPSEDTMTARPRTSDEHLLTPGNTYEIIFFGFLIGLLSFINFALFSLRNGGPFLEPVGDDMATIYAGATTMAWVTLAFCQFMNIMSRRFDHTSIFNRNLFSNRKLLIVIVLSIMMILMAVYVPTISYFLNFAPLALEDWLYVGMAMGIFIAVFELVKVVKRWRLRRYGPGVEIGNVQ
ncbi:MAG: cation-transporting P-type ATPase [Candidatus Thermoplasmatota archaeon]|nr:cation-transporting P-type ATPase [Euryarchaeota archaeon]MBU4031675.1 cation-transporting P-type ATPase [Candidatus Thermoplasmatota archaeon]MBU4071284.1 cation-transporting P-type ATPase [Candidatus Thermoplasmatota archaeon]MBU4144336.1 cation-transporting P-type ATPase [Candidatus Thermoplasmatota archaeon]MBU4591932.1 cation-transporting P-type ATPase [Candidatus Thermoplasmatota archaeon]